MRPPTLLAVTLVAALVAALVGGCGDAEPVPPTADGASLRACVVPTPLWAERDTSAPHGFVGHDVELLEHVAASMDAELVLTGATFDDVVAGAATGEGRCDLAVGGLTTQGIDPDLVPSRPYRDEVLLVVGPGATGRLPGFGPQALLGHVRDPEVRALAEEVTADVLAYPSLLDAIGGLDTGRAAALLVPVEQLPTLRTEVPGVRVLGEVPTGGQVHLLLRADAAAELVTSVDAAIEAWVASGDAADAGERWFG